MRDECINLALFAMHTTWCNANYLDTEQEGGLFQTGQVPLADLETPANSKHRISCLANSTDLTIP